MAAFAKILVFKEHPWQIQASEQTCKSARSLEGSDRLRVCRAAEITINSSFISLVRAERR